MTLAAAAGACCGVCLSNITADVEKTVMALMQGCHAAQCQIQMHGFLPSAAIGELSLQFTSGKLAICWPLLH